MNVVGIITARGGSKGVPRKNLAMVAGRTLLAWTAEAARGAERLTQVLLSTDDPEIADEGRRLGLQVPFLRPARLATDSVPTVPVLRHAVEFLEDRGDRVDAVCLLQPTNPMRTSDIIDGCIELLEKSGADSVVTTLPVPAEYNPHWVYWRDEDGTLTLCTGNMNPIARRQELPEAFHREGSVYVTRRDVLMNESSLYGRRMLGYPLQRKNCVNIDTPEDLEVADRMLRQTHTESSTAC